MYILKIQLISRESLKSLAVDLLNYPGALFIPMNIKSYLLQKAFRVTSLIFFFFLSVSRFNTETPLSSDLGSLGTSESFSFCSVTSMYVLP